MDGRQALVNEKNKLGRGDRRWLMRNKLGKGGWRAGRDAASHFLGADGSRKWNDPIDLTYGLMSIWFFPKGMVNFDADL